ncbi:prenyltransferase [Thalassotalea ponticola]|uniref:prenyltransferase n=1 Tax=Thalassotalea ponticola TaxID=1523392 RepID=UPI0025B34118|nr:prenyltransferase [Thalassotalea ponticola]MDN3651584.1 prenyltransferase [Thalassotalea ponticola]
MSPFRALCKALRLPFLTLTLSCLALVYALLVWHQVNFVAVHFALVCLAAIAAHIGVNALNEYQDFQSGLDLHTQRTPFSGGSGALPAQPEAAKNVVLVAYCCLLLVALIGVYFVWLSGPGLALVGALGLVIIITYTPYINRWPVACLLAPGIGFGGLIVGASFWLLSKQLTEAAMIAMLVTAVVTSNLLLLNQIPDRVVDKQFGRNHFVIAYGVSATLVSYSVLMLMAMASLCIGYYALVLPKAALWALAPLFLHFVCLDFVRRSMRGKNSAHLHTALLINVLVANSLPLVLALALLNASHSPYVS